MSCRSSGLFEVWWNRYGNQVLPYFIHKYDLGITSSVPAFLCLVYVGVPLHFDKVNKS